MGRAWLPVHAAISFSKVLPQMPFLVLDFMKPSNHFPSLRYNEEDTKKLKAYHSLHGNDWKKIGAMVARSSLSVALKFSQIGGSKWLLCEISP